MGFRLRTATVALVCFGLAATAGAATPAELCRAAKLQAAGTYGLCRTKAEAKALRSARAVDVASCDRKLESSWLRAEERGGCDPIGDLAAVRAQVIADVAALVDTLTPEPPPPTTCGVFPGCGGACPAGQSCWAAFRTGVGATCDCLPSTATACGDTGGHFTGARCGGACPAGQVCTTGYVDETLDFQCGCIPAGATPCILSGAPACGGACPAGRTCAPEPLNGCACQ
jgi:hypothetical protein